MTDTDPATSAYDAILTSIAAFVAPGGDPREHLRVAAWILEQMADTFVLLAFSNAVDECAEARAPHPYAPRSGGSYDDRLDACAAAGGVPAGLREEAQRLAVLLYGRIMAAAGGYDPAPALLRWVDDPAGDTVSRHWREKAATVLEATSRCWGHYAVMSAVGRGVCWEDDNAPLRAEDGTELLRPGYPLRVYAEGPVWSDAYTDAAAIAADRDLEQRNEAAREAREAYERKARTERE